MSEAPKRRTQVTLFVPPPHAGPLDALRGVLDPVQAVLIAAHVTLCRDDEVDGLDPVALSRAVAAWPHGHLQLEFGPPRRFGGHGVMLPCVGGNAWFQALRCWVLQDAGARVHDPHLTLAHPRNPRSADNTDDAMACCPHALSVTFGIVSLVEQDASAPWRTCREAPLGVPPGRFP